MSKSSLRRASLKNTTIIVIEQGSGHYYNAISSSESEARELAEAILTLLDGEKPQNPKETGKEEDWAHRLASALISSEGRRAYPDVNVWANTIRHWPMAENDSELEASFHSNCEKDHTIVMLSQQLADKKEIIRRLTT